MRLKLSALSLSAVLSFCALNAAHAGTVVGNLDDGSGFSSTVTSQSPSGTSPLWIAQQFTTGDLGSVTGLSQIIVSLGLFDPGNSNFFITGELFADTGDAPGTKLLDLTRIDGLSETGFANVAFNPGAAFDLASNTSYWFVIKGYSEDGSGNVDWEYANSDTPTSGTGSLSFFATSDDQGVTWTSTPVGGADTPYLIQVSTIPEPSSILIAAIGFSTVVGAARVSRRRRQLA